MDEKKRQDCQRFLHISPCVALCVGSDFWCLPGSSLAKPAGFVAVQIVYLAHPHGALGVSRLCCTARAKARVTPQQSASVEGLLWLLVIVVVKVHPSKNMNSNALPEGSRGIFAGGGGSVRIPNLTGVACMTDMMLTGRVYNAADGERIGLAQYLVPKGRAFDKALELAERIAQNAPLTNYAPMHAPPRTDEQPADHSLFTEALMAAVAQSAPEAKLRVLAFLDGKAEKVKHEGACCKISPPDFWCDAGQLAPRRWGRSVPERRATTQRLRRPH